MKRVASEQGVPAFVLNTHADGLRFGESVEQTLARGQKYLETGAETVYAFAGQRGITKAEAAVIIERLSGRVNFGLGNTTGGVSVRELADMGVARVSVGPAMMLVMKSQFVGSAGEILGGEALTVKVSVREAAAMLSAKKKGDITSYRALKFKVIGVNVRNCD